MAIHYVVAQRVNPRDVAAPRKYHAVAKSAGEETVRQFATEISKRTGLSSSEVFAVIEAFIDLLPDQLLDGKIVRLGDFGGFFITLQSEGVDKAQDFDATKITGNTIHFRPGKILKKALLKPDYKKAAE